MTVVSNMRRHLLHFLFLGYLFFSGCSILKPVTVEVDEEKGAREAYLSGNFEEALLQYELLIETRQGRQQEVEGRYYNFAGLSAFSVGQTTRALDHLERARHTDAVNDETYAALALAYREIDNLSREITHLENYLVNYPQGAYAPAFRIRYFETLVESQNWQQAFERWPELDEEARSQEALLNQYYLVNKSLGNEDEADRIAAGLIALNPDNYDALDRLAKKYFHRADERYQQEMAAYDRNRTQRQYAQLLEAYEVLNEDFRTALKYFIRLYDMNPTKEYASYLLNIYTRFQDDERVRYFRQKLQE